MRRLIGVAVAVSLLGTGEPAPAAAPPTPKATFTQKQLAWLRDADGRIDSHALAGRFDEAASLAGEVAEMRERVQGRGHWEARGARLNADFMRRLEAIPRQKREAAARGQGLLNSAMSLARQARHREAERAAREAVAVFAEALGESHLLTANARNTLASALHEQGRPREAMPLYRKALEVRREVLGEKHPWIATSYGNLASCLLDQGKPAEALPLLRKAHAVSREALGEGHPNTARSCANLAACLHTLGKDAEARPLFEKALATRREVLGEDHRDTAMSYNNLGRCLHALGKPSEALPLLRRGLASARKSTGENHPVTATLAASLAATLAALARPAEALAEANRALGILRKTLGEDHPRTASAYDQAAYCLDMLGRHAEALPLHQKALEVRRARLGEMHQGTAQSYDSTAGCLLSLGRYAEAAALLRKALAICSEVLGENHPSTAVSYHNLASCLQRQGRHAEALALTQKSLAVCLEALGESHFRTAAAYNDVGTSLAALGRNAEALPLYRKALEIRRKALGEDHPHTGISYNDLGMCLTALDRHADALPLFRRSLAVARKVHGERHPSTALGHSNIGFCLAGMGRYDEALPAQRAALAINREVLGEEHPATATSFNNTASSLWLLGRRAEAVRVWQASLAAQEASRFHLAASGFDRAHANRPFPHALLAVGLARLGQPVNAFAHAERSLARGLLDDLASPSSAEVAAALALQSRLEELSGEVALFAGRGDLTAEQRSRRDVAACRYRRTSAELARLLSEGSARQVLPLSRIQGAIPDDAALVLWVDVEVLKERWGCVVRRDGPPAWVRIDGSGKEGAWGETDRALPLDLYDALRDPASSAAERRRLAAAFAARRLGPLKPHLKAKDGRGAVKRLFVVPSGDMAYIPAEALTDEYAVSYVPSGSFLARLAETHRAAEVSSLLALGDPAFERGAPAEPPAHGAMVKAVAASGHAAEAGLRPGDVLLSVGAVRVDGPDDVGAALAAVPAKAVVWRDGKQLSVRLTRGPVGATFDQRSARAAVRAWRKEGGPVVWRGTGHKRLPGTRREVEAILDLVGRQKGTVLLDSEASEQRLDELASRGKLKGYRVLHFATHAEVDWRRPERSALVLAQDALPDPEEQARLGRKVYEGRLTVSAIRGWELDCDLVVLSACQTGLGRGTGGDGLLGFSQAFLSRGARAVVLSRWPVDDAATALLMVRFYQNLLGKRDGLNAPMGRAAALDEAKRWLRALTIREAEKAIESLPRGKLVAAPKGQAKSYDHPHYWAAFTLIGDPD